MNKDKALGIGILVALLLGISSLWQTTSLSSKVADVNKMASSTQSSLASTTAATITNEQNTQAIINFINQSIAAQQTQAK